MSIIGYTSLGAMLHNYHVGTSKFVSHNSADTLMSVLLWPLWLFLSGVIKVLNWVLHYWDSRRG